MSFKPEQVFNPRSSEDAHCFNSARTLDPPLASKVSMGSHHQDPVASAAGFLKLELARFGDFELEEFGLLFDRLFAAG